MQKVTLKVIDAKPEPVRCVAIIVKRGREVITARISPELRASIDGPSPQRVADWPKGAA